MVWNWLNSCYGFKMRLEENYMVNLCCVKRHRSDHKYEFL
uniref:Uncharacterized protein n=1 Tax=Anguilla anguilla TaxID=7936 RepID=A0A0E9Q0A5_ANGAN